MIQGFAGKRVVGQGFLTASGPFTVGASQLVAGGEFSPLKTEAIAGDLVVLLATAKFVKGATAGASVLSIGPQYAGPGMWFWDNVTGTAQQSCNTYQGVAQTHDLFVAAIVSWLGDGFQYWRITASSSGSNATVSGVALWAAVLR